MKYTDSSHLFHTNNQGMGSLNNLSTHALFSASTNQNELDKRSVSMPDMGEINKSDPYKLPARRMIALFDYDPTLNSPNVDCEVLFSFIFFSYLLVW